MLTAKEDGLQFLNIQQPLQIKSAENRRLVRGNATLSRNKKEAPIQTGRAGNERNPNEANECVRLPRMIGSVRSDSSSLPLTSRDKLKSYRKPAPKMANITKKVKQSLAYELFPFKATGGFHPGHMMLQSSVSDARVLQSTLSISSFAQAWQANRDKKFQIWGLDHRGRTIQLINKSLGDQMDECFEGTALAVTQVASIEFARGATGDCDAWKSHMRGLSQLFYMRGGLGTFPSLWYNVSEVDFMGSYMFAHAPFFSSNDYQPFRTARSNLDVWSDSTAQSLSSPNNVARSKLRLLPETHCLGEELNSVLAEMHVLNEDFPHYSERPYSRSHINHILKFRRTIEFRLFNLLYKNPPASCNAQYAYILALQIYVNRVFRTFERSAQIPSRLAARLRHALLEIKIDGNDQWEQLSGLLLWMSVVGGAACANGALRMWYIIFTSNIGSRMSLGTWERFNAVLKDRLYSAEDLAESFRELWNDGGGDFFIGAGAGIVWSEAAGLAINDSVDDYI
ncbi:hypothetical protein NA57DRAFT_55648 [Rhizodiscina lignyota]|uniref:Uncharacterized protein n=1 Tax=Rhizodiscina lignyota TaxID=1504668 RepID=A0A9P4M9T8_9PEZI|nr:hypothetical protein NA57DRAFT_55648 [Rhizodiscina lignyota]